MKHPAKYSDSLLPYINRVLPNDSHTILDPFAGTGKLRKIRPNCFLLEIEPEWANINGAIIGDATSLPFKSHSVDAICTSPTYGNRMADSFVDRKTDKGYVRHTYRHYIGRKLHSNNSGGMQWGAKYRDLHKDAWCECFRVLKPSGIMVLNISNHIRKGKLIDVAQWHIDTIEFLGMQITEHIKVETKRQRQGSNGNVRVDFESIIVFKK